jgi:signal transduction histidine kinase/ligand-binding sensor domain-containing protein
MSGIVGIARGRARRVVALGVTLACMLLAGRPCAHALDPSLDINQYAHTSWKVRDGFVKGGIDAVAQTPDGYLWLGTAAGLFRFDGVHAVPWQPPENQHLPPGQILSLLVSRDGSLWIGAKGLARWKEGRLIQYEELRENFVFALLEDREGTVWAGGASRPYGKLCSIRSSNINCYGDDGKLGVGVFALYEDSTGHLWAGVPDGLWRWNPDAPKFYRMPGETNGIQGIAEDSAGEFLVGRVGGIYRFIEGKIRPKPLTGIPHQFPTRRILRDRNGGLWIGTWHHGLEHVHQGRTDVFTAIDGLSGDDIHNLFQDREGNIWVFTVEGLDRFRDFAVTTLTTKQGLSSTVVGSILAGKDGSLWLGTYSGLNRWQRGQISSVFGSRPDRIGPQQSLFRDSQGRILLSTVGGLGFLENDRINAIKDVPRGIVLSITQDTDGKLWTINEGVGILSISPRNAVSRIPWSDLGHKDPASVLAADRRQGGLWIGFFLGGLVYFSNGQARKSYTASDGMGAGRVGDLLFDDDGTLWISTEGGFSHLKNDHVATLNSKNGLPCDVVNSAIEADDRSFWLYTACGLVRIARSEIDAWSTAVDKREDGTRRIQVTAFDGSDGIIGRANPDHYHPVVAKTTDGKLWFIPEEGVSLIDPRHIPFNGLPPPVHIEQVTADGKAYDPARGLSLPARVQHVDIDYTALSLVAPEKNRFRFKLEGYDHDWRDVGNRRQAFYTNLPPRHYTFRVMACNNSGVWNETGASLEFSVLPAYYQTTWFRSLCVAAFLGLLWALYQLRLHQVQRQFATGLEARVGERLRIARELHDTLLQSFQGVAFQLQAARKLILRKSDNAEQVLDDAILATEEAIREGRSAIRDLRPEPAAQRNLSELLDAAGRELATAHQLNGQAPSYRVLIEGKQQDISPMLQDEVYRITREVIRNAFAHAAASHIEVEIRYDQDQLRLRVRDDGKGIDPKVLAGGQSGHFGIPGMRERAQRIGAHLNFWSEMGAGAEVELTVPASMAYQKRRKLGTRLTAS